MGVTSKNNLRGISLSIMLTWKTGAHCGRLTLLNTLHSSAWTVNYLRLLFWHYLLSRGCVVTINNYKRTKDAALIYAFKRKSNKKRLHSRR